MCAEKGYCVSEIVTIIIDFNNPGRRDNKTFSVAYQKNMTIHQALIAVYDAYHPIDRQFTFDLRYSGNAYGYFVQTLCNVPTTLSTSWEIRIDDTPSQKGIDTNIDRPGRKIAFRYILDTYMQVV